MDTYVIYTEERPVARNKIMGAFLFMFIAALVIYAALFAFVAVVSKFDHPAVLTPVQTTSDKITLPPNTVINYN